MCAQSALVSNAQTSTQTPVQPATSLPLLRELDSSVMSPQGQRLAVETRDHGVWIVGVPSGQVESRIETGDSLVTSMAWNDTGSTLAVRRMDGELTLTHFQPSVQTSSKRICREGRFMSFAENGTTLVVECGKTHVKRISTSDLKELGELALAGDTMLSALAVSQDGRMLAVGDDHGRVGVCSIDKLSAGLDKIVSVPTPAHRGVTALAFDPNADHLALGGPDCNVRIWSLRVPNAGLRILSHCPQDVFGDLKVAWVRYSPDGHRLVSTTRSFLQAIVWDVSDGSAVTDTDFVCGFPRVLPAWFSRDGRTLTLSLDLRQLKLPPSEIKSRSEPPKSLLNWWSLDGEYAWGVVDGALVIRKVDSPQPVLRLPMDAK